MTHRLPTWLAVLAVVIGLGSIGTTYSMNQHQAHEDHRVVCGLVDQQNGKTREFVAKLVSDPSVPAAYRAQITELALRQFPQQSCAVATAPTTTTTTR